MSTNTTQPGVVMLLRARRLGADHQRSPGIEDAIIEAQRRACRHAAEQLNARLVREYVEHGGTGTIGKRPVLRLLLDELRALRDVRYVIVAKPDRLARRRYDLATIQFELEAAGAELVVADQPLTTRKEVLA
jgi:DNA invertase Pin-like site-specific DNA recombinase